MAQVGHVRDVVNTQLSRSEARELFDLLGRTAADGKHQLTELEEGLARVFIRDAA